jgi:hypothetical protein
MGAGAAAADLGVLGVGFSGAHAWRSDHRRGACGLRLFCLLFQQFFLQLLLLCDRRGDGRRLWGAKSAHPGLK